MTLDQEKQRIAKKFDLELRGINPLSRMPLMVERKAAREFLMDSLDALHAAVVRGVGVDENTSDGYHTFKELYEFRKVYNAALFNEWATQGKYEVHKSRKHSDGEDCFGGGWFVVVAQLPNGQITNHYENSDWDLFQVPERETAAEWDKHTAQDVLTRLTSFLSAPNKDKEEV